MKGSDIRLQREVDTLRAILFSKIGLLEDSASEVSQELSQTDVSMH